ncbi:MAG: hypothetical protein KAU31_03885, partial [Spirochaetaceae bacterium]|nr:hypothetical protein [Spirochaetaceae bacterium]
NAMPFHEHPRMHATMVATEKTKLVLMHSSGEGELYDLTSDANESHNLFEDSRHSDLKIEMLQLMCNRMAWTVDPLPRRQAHH